MNNLGWFTAAPHSWKSEDADQIINAALKALDLLCKISGLHIHNLRPPQSNYFDQLAVGEIPSGTHPVAQRKDSAEGFLQ